MAYAPSSVKIECKADVVLGESLVNVIALEKACEVACAQAATGNFTPKEQIVEFAEAFREFLGRENSPNG